jgi:hypothetical protein
MFVRFRSSRSRARLQVSIIEPHRVGGKVRAEHVAGLGAIAQPATVIDRVEFWQSLHAQLPTLGNRIPDPASILAAVHARIPLPTPEEQRAAMLEAAEADAQLWEALGDMNQSMADDNRGLAGDVERKAAAAQQAADSAKVKAEAAADRVSRLKRGEPVNGGLRRPVDIRQVFRDAGWSERDMQRARDVHALSEAGQFERYLDQVHKAHRRAENAVLRRLTPKRSCR